MSCMADDLKGFIKYVSEKSGVPIDDILRWYNTRMLDPAGLSEMGDYVVVKYVWLRLTEMNNAGELKDL